MPKKDPFKAPGAVKFQLVHRSQRDPLIHDPEASQVIFKPISGKKDNEWAQSETLQAMKEATAGDRPNVGEASKYGVYFDDTEYDYMQHLRSIGDKEDNVDSILLEVPTTSKRKNAPPITLKDPSVMDGIPSEYLPPKVELPHNYESQREIPSAISGFRPDMNPHLRQTLEALEDDAFVDDGLEDDFFAELVKDGEAKYEEDLDFPFEEQGVNEDDEARREAEDVVDEDDDWEARFKRFKKSQDRVAHVQEEMSEKDYMASEGGDTIASLPEMSVRGIRKRRKKAGSEASGYTMSSSSMFRNEGLTTLDERFDKVLENEYENDHDSDCECPDCDDRPARLKRRAAGDSPTSEDSDEAPDLITTRDDFDGILNEFLNDYEIVGHQLEPVLEGQTGLEKLETLRKAIAGVDLTDASDESKLARQKILKIVKMQESKRRQAMDEVLIVPEGEDEDEKDRWDCETILSTYSNLENHPRIIRARDTRKVRKIRLDAKTGLPVVEEEGQDGSTIIKTRKQPPTGSVPLDRTVLHGDFAGNKADDDGRLKNPSTLSFMVLTPSADPPRPQVPLTRSRNESKEEKAARKAAVKADKQARRTEKKNLKETFASEKQAQIKAQVKRQQGGLGLKKL
ncbi:hypothetical protein FRC00_013895 [Tulasnella sp. 408]|nr:hypothetical protein FRC00_013895 [Tulasnella sp. 408]